MVSRETMLLIDGLLTWLQVLLGEWTFRADYS